MARSTPGRPSKNSKDATDAEKEKRAILGKIKKDTQSGKKMSPRDIADVADASYRQGQAEQRRMIEDR